MGIPLVGPNELPVLIDGWNELRDDKGVVRECPRHDWQRYSLQLAETELDTVMWMQKPGARLPLLKILEAEWDPYGRRGDKPQMIRMRAELVLG